MSDSNIIPNEVQPLGPMWQRLPIEVTMDILGHAIMLVPVYNKPGRVVDKKWFGILTGLGMFIKSRQYCKPFPMAMMKAFYQGNDFVFEREPTTHHSTPWLTSAAPALPPQVCRGFLRRIQITLRLEDFYNVPQSTMPGDYKPMRRCAIRSVEELFKYSPGARCLRTLTDESDGFCNLDSLDLIIITDFRMGDEAALELIEEAAFAVRARKVTITVPCHPGHGTSARFGWLPEVADLIAVESLT
jgi:hypothetical protein